MQLEYFRPIRKSSAVTIALLAIMTALATIMTIVIQIPYPGTSGYFNLGDTMVMLAGLLLGPVGGFFAGGVGSALADVITGYTFYAPITLIVKGFEGMAVGYFSFKVKERVRISKWDIVGVLVGAIVMLTGYFVAQFILFGMAVAIGELVTINLAQVVIGGSVALLIGPTIGNSLRETTTTYSLDEEPADPATLEDSDDEPESIQLDP